MASSRKDRPPKRKARRQRATVGGTSQSSFIATPQGSTQGKPESPRNESSRTEREPEDDADSEGSER